MSKKNNSEFIQSPITQRLDRIVFATEKGVNFTESEMLELSKRVYDKIIILPGKKQCSIFNDSVIRLQDLFDIIEQMGYSTFDTLPI